MVLAWRSLATSYTQRRFINYKLKEFMYNISNFRKYGLWRDDCLDDMFNDDVVEAIRRLPPRIQDERNYRILRAMQLSLSKKILPKEQWTKLEDDKLYLTPYVDEVVREREEKEEWAKRY